MRILVGALAVLMGVVPAWARPDTRAMTCAEVNAFIAEEGAVVMTTGPHTYRRFVADERFCDRWETAGPEWAPARDGRCAVESVCQDPIEFDDMWD